ncbi:MAG TPA: hypothetical protein DEV72_17860 [Ktedonobacter sp.]|nr:hypothetical protein [Ktedonobacter sp.]
MNLQQTARQTTVNREQHQEADTRLHGHWLLLARFVWIAIFVLTLVVFCANLIVGSYGLVTTILLVAVTSVYFAVGIVLFWHKSTDRFVLLMSQGLVVGGVFIGPFPNALIQWNWVWAFPISFLDFLAGATLILGYTLPDGRFVPSWTRWLALGWIAVTLVTNLPVSSPGVFYPWNWWSSSLFTLVQIAFYCSLALALLYRYRWVSTPVQRQQIKWIVFASTIVVVEISVANLVLSVIPSYFPALVLSIQLKQLVLSVTYIVTGLIPFSIGIALLRYRLWDIDRVINRTLVYALLSTILALIYVALIIASQSLVRVLTGAAAQQPIIIVGSTLVIAALFQPLRRRIQQVIDLRFYRRKYDAKRIIDAFSMTLRAETDLTRLSEQLVAVVQETMQPTHVSLWLRKPGSDAERHAKAWESTPPSPENTGGSRSPIECSEEDGWQTSVRLF